MRKLLLAACLVGFSIPVMASCEDTKAQIDAKLQANGIKNYTLEIVSVPPTTAAASGVAAAPAKQATGKVVGICEGNSKQIVYTRN
jgi:hypothetical protein